MGDKRLRKDRRNCEKDKNTQKYSCTLTENSVGLILSEGWKNPVHEEMKGSYSNMSRSRLDNPADSRTVQLSQGLISQPRG
jgi:hypothetical protein